MQKTFYSLITILLIACFVVCMPILSHMEGSDIPHGQENISPLTYQELQVLLKDINGAMSTFHALTEPQMNSVLKATKASAEAYFSNKGLKVTGWAWYDSEYTYARDWDRYVLKTHLDYKDSDNRGHKSNIYSNVYFYNGAYIVTYLTADDTIIVDTRSDYGNSYWFKQPEPYLNSSTGIDLSTYTVDELKALSVKIQDEIQKNHSVSSKVSSIILTVTKSELEQFCLKNNVDIKSYAWYDSEYNYIRDWDYYTLETHLDYTSGSTSSQKTDKLYSEVCFINEKYELVFLKLGSRVILDKRDLLVTSSENEIPRYSWASSSRENEKRNSLSISDPVPTPQIVYVTPEPQPEITPAVIYITPAPTEESESDSISTPQIVYVTPEPQPEITPAIEYITPAPIETYGVFAIAPQKMSDEQLEEAASAIKAEQRARIKTHIVINPTEVELFVGKSQKIEATVVDLPEGEPSPRLEWITSDKNIVTCNKGQIRAIAGGTATITCKTALSDGTIIDGSCTITVNVPVSAISVDSRYLNLSVGEKHTPVFSVKPSNASNTSLSFESSNSNVASVTKDGTIEATGAGNATITAKALDGSGKSITISVKVVDNRISKETLKKLLMFSTCNDVAEDIFTADGMYYDKKKLHDYSYFKSVLKIIDEGKWTTNDGGNHWHVKDFLVQHKTYGGFWQYSFDVSFNGKNYVLSNGWSVHAGKRSWLDKSDPTKYGEDDLSNLDYYIYLTVSPKQIGD